ncbi:metalloprotease TldD [Laribacter hongkongensis]|uniref:Metalloprotease TldD n=3 Tax=Laribacter hongkongensis TaxID=168471 RepID=A0ABD4SSA8_9NEIS|nr:metalloprotease TldD [Laribacter hongkongensis]MCG9025892.1 metalloprotease TldD [Laribacter hongkongensis]MCG9099466.1 metalloprotease TldD [Laribacter hongkongensis]MCG9102552.1 metalloprotease TldD [Laribacter hongkongensis]MCG9113792.1 metalloprotease TldD [Laribacter hongkongensis]MCG9117924.1 metalloprotease TldD [Laribacter hongkongensis]
MTTESHLDIATGLLLTRNGLTPAALDQVFARLGQHDVDYADLYFQYTRQEGWSLDEGIVKSGSFNIDEGVGVRAVAGEKTAFAYSDEISLDALLSAADITRAIGRTGGDGRVQAHSRTTGHALFAPIDPIASLDSASKVALLNRLEQMARGMDSRVKQVMAGLAAEYDVMYVARRDGTHAADVRPLVRLSVTVIAEHQGRREQGSAGGGGRFDLAFFTDEVLHDYARKAVDQALVNLEARPAPAGQMTVVLGSGWPGVLLHEAIGHGLEGDFNRKGTSAFAGRLGERVAAPGVTVVDDGTLANRRGSLNIDDEGTPTSCTTLIEDGILKGYMQDSLNARLTGTAPTGNARRESYAHIPMPRMTNTYMLAGDKAPEEIIASVERGLYAVNFGGGQVDITSGKFVFSASEAWMIENGKLSYPVKGATLIGSGPEVLNHVSMIGNDLALDTGVGVCGKEGQSVPVGVGQPTLRIDGGLTVGGTA